MKLKNILLATFALSTIVSAKLPVNLGINFSSGYDRINISQDEFEKFALGDASNNGYSSGSVVTKISVDAVYPIKLKNATVSLGGGIDGFIENKVGVPVLKSDNSKFNEIEVLKNSQKELKREVFVLYNDYANKEYGYLIAKYKYEEAKDISENGENKLAKIDSEIAGSTGNEEEKQQTLRDLQAELETQKVAAKNKRLEQIENENKRKELLKKLEVTPENDPKVENLVLEINKLTEDYKTLVEELNEINKTRKDYLNSIEEINSIDDVVKNLKESKTKLMEKIAKKDETLKSTKEKFDNSETLYNEAKTRKEELEKQISENTNKIKALKSSEGYNEYEKYESTKLIQEKLNSQLNFGVSLYAISEISGNIYGDLEAYLNTKIGVKISRNPLYALAVELEKNHTKINGEEYIMPENAPMLKVVPKLEIGLGLKYKGFKTTLSSGLNTGLVTLGLGYEF